jgi:hypothetical protein
MPRIKQDHRTIVDYLKHGDKRSNIPTEELRDFVAEQERAPKVVLHPRTPQVKQPFAMPALPCHLSLLGLK